MWHKTYSPSPQVGAERNLRGKPVSGKDGGIVIIQLFIQTQSGKDGGIVIIQLFIQTQSLQMLIDSIILKAC